MAEWMAMVGDQPAGIRIPEKSPETGDQGTSSLANDVESLAAGLYIQVRVDDQTSQAAKCESRAMDGRLVEDLHNNRRDGPGCDGRGDGMSFSVGHMGRFYRNF